MNRRALLKAIPAVAAAGVVPAVTLSGEVLPPEDETRIIALFRRHQELVDQAAAYGNETLILDAPDAEEIMDRLFYNEIFAIEEKMMSIPCKTPGDFAAKMIVATSRGEVSSDWEEGEIWAEARALVGMMT
ncbi:hypothetical protein SAMN04489859_10378 [Paracoccus alcaliphilus]|uniref:Tat (Twin-arginine translocation) pathway signal sequence n=1 Tax=Paracoccus alcaliphilus TaxID=34002 RepID=A0A1H8M7C8_9RHOB|nr:hypothetical protein [Paracoccus alcaliphilus]WCR16989.1 hypothetical protein JHW40_11325 [Paracoccus alcaliphilus]SEO13225.1 hypothetical protein SAMN04489859_10378 [Paracoccus alcaliphilus]